MSGIENSHLDNPDVSAIQEQEKNTDLFQNQTLVDTITQKYANEKNANEVLATFQKIASNKEFGVKFVELVVKLEAPYKDIQALSALLEQLNAEQENLTKQEIDTFLVQLNDLQTDATQDIAAFRSEQEKKLTAKPEISNWSSATNATPEQKTVAKDLVKETAEKLWVNEKVGEIDANITKTIEKMPKEKYADLKEALKKWDFKEIMSKFGELVGWVFDTIFWAWGNNKSEQLLNVNDLDFTKYSYEELACSKDKIIKWTSGELEFTTDKGSIIGQLELKRNEAKSAWDLVKELMYAASLSKAKDTLYAKFTLNKDEITNEEINWVNTEMQYARLQSQARPGDMIFFAWGPNQKRYEKMLESGSDIPAKHVWIIGDPKDTLYHSTGKKYGTDRDWVHKVDLQSELNERGRPINLMLVRTWWTQDAIGKVLTKADEMEKQGVRFDGTDAVSSLMWSKDLDQSKVNCWDFVNECFKQSGMYTEVTRAWVPANLLKHDGFSIEYVTKYS